MGILQVFEEFYRPVNPKNPASPGQIWWVPVPEIAEVPRILDASRHAPDEHAITNFEITEIGPHHFTSRDRLPIKRLQLGDTEEIIVSKAKKRPVVLLAAAHVSDTDSLPAGHQERLAKHLRKSTFLVAPFYSVSSMLAPGTFGPALVARIRALQYLHLFCLPKRGTPGEPDSIIRLDRAFPSYLGRGCDRDRLQIHEEPFEILLSQLSLLLGGVYSEPYRVVREVVQDTLPDGLN